MKPINHIIGLSRIGYKRDLKNILEKCFYYWKDDFDSNFSILEEFKKKILYKNWITKLNHGISYLNIGDFSFYDHILDSLLNFDSFPKRFENENNKYKLYFKCVKGYKNQQPMGMVKWFNTNYHYVVPEYKSDTTFNFNNFFLQKDIKYCKILKKNIKFIIIGIFTLLKLGKIKDNKLKNKILLLPNLLENYIKILNYLNNENYIKVIQIDEPILILNLSDFWLKNIKNVYTIICSYFSNIIFSTYFEEINKNFLNYIKEIPFYSLHIDILKNSQSKYFLNNYIKSKKISLGIIDCKNVWINNIEKIWYKLKNFFKKKIFLSTNCSLMHIPIDCEEDFKKNKMKNLISFGTKKIKELEFLSRLYFDFIKNKNNFKFIKKFFIKNLFFIKNKKKSKLIFNNKLQKKLRKMDFSDFSYRKINFFLRYEIQKKFFNIKILQSTTIGSFPQTKKIRNLRMHFKNNKISKNEYENFIKKEINYIIKKQLDYKIDIIVHGEPERNDMVEYFAENLNGFFITNNGWVQSYGSRYVKPPVIYGDIYLKNYITINWLKYSQKLTEKPVKGMLTGPITIMKWSFRRVDQPNYITCIQLSIIINKEILKLEKLGIKIIQIDEPAIREFLPIKKNQYKIYFNWIIKSFLPIYKNLKETTQIHTHICYSDFKNIINFIKLLDVDVVSIESSRSNFEILPKITKNFNIGLGVYDIHNENILNINKSLYLIKLIINNLNLHIIWINPDCGLKTRKWKEINKSLINMIESSNIIKNFLK